MPTVDKIEGYPLSRDYERLAELVTKSSIACIVDFDHDCRDIAHTIYSSSSGTWQVSARGIGYIWAASKEDFIQQCERLNLEYFDFPRTL